MKINILRHNIRIRAIAAAIALLFLSTGILAQNADALLKKGYDLHLAEDYNGAILEYTKLIALKPEMALAYYNRAGAYEALTKYDLAFADYSKAIELSPKWFATYLLRASLFDLTSQYYKAIADYSTAIKLKPTDQGYEGRAKVYAKMDGFEAHAISDLTDVIGAFPKSESAYYGRAQLYLRQAKLDEAYRDAEAGLAIKPPTSWPDGLGMVAIGYLALRKQGKNAEAKAFLNKWIAKAAATSWPRKILEYMNGGLTEIKFLGSARTPDEMVIARSYVGEMQLLAGNFSAAESNFIIVKTTGNRNLFEYHLAAAELDRIQAKKQ